MGGHETTTEEQALLASVRHGQELAYAELYNRHQLAAHQLARQVVTNPSDAEDLVAEAFTNILGLLRRGGGPDVAFRAYLFTTIRHLAAATNSRARRIVHTGERDLLDRPVPFVDPVLAEQERVLVTKAFIRLPQRWRHALWLTEVELVTASEIGKRFGLSRNSAAALVYRARNGLRDSYAKLSRSDHRLSACAGGPRRP